MGIAAVNAQESIWRYVPGKGDNGTQINLLIDRQDNCINICEMKFSTDQFIIDAGYGAALKNKLDVFKTKRKTRKTIFLTMITTNGNKQNVQYVSLVQQNLEMRILFLK